jgi:hypothetical protein
MASLIIKYSPVRDLSRRHLIQSTPPLRIASNGDIPRLVLKKCDICSAFPDFSSPDADVDLKLIKQETLHDLYASLSTPLIGQLLGVPHVSALFRMVGANLFRPFPNVSLTPAPDFIVDREYVHVGIVYKIATALVAFTAVPRPLVVGAVDELFLNCAFKLIYAWDAREQAAALELLTALVRNFPWAAPRLFKAATRTLSNVLNDGSSGQHTLSTLVSLLVVTIDGVIDGISAAAFFSGIVLPIHRSSA